MDAFFHPTIRVAGGYQHFCMILELCSTDWIPDIEAMTCCAMERASYVTGSPIYHILVCDNHISIATRTQPDHNNRPVLYSAVMIRHYAAHSREKCSTCHTWVASESAFPCSGFSSNFPSLSPMTRSMFRWRKWSMPALKKKKLIPSIQAQRKKSPIPLITGI